MRFIAPLALTLWLAVFFPLLASAQDRLPAREGRFIPSDIELKAVYCLSVVASQRRELEDIIVSTQTHVDREKNPQIRESLGAALIDAREYLSTLEDRSARLYEFIGPRRSRLDSSSLMSAMNRGEQDHRASKAASSACSRECPTDSRMAECYKECASRSDSLRSVHQCNDISFLPY